MKKKLFLKNVFFSFLVNICYLQEGVLQVVCFNFHTTTVDSLLSLTEVLVLGSVCLSSHIIQKTYSD